MNTNPRGYCLIINMTKKRDGTKEDAEELKNLFQNKLKFVVKEYKDLTHEDIKELMKNIKSPHPPNRSSDMCCFVMFILAHGNTYSGKDDEQGEECKIGSAFFETHDEKKMPVSTIKKSIETAPALRGKPKLLFIQACRGEKDDEGVVAMQKDATEIIPSGSDFLVSFATIVGFPAYRHEKKGTVFIQNLVETFGNDENIDRYDIVSLMTKVTGKVAKEKVDTVYKQNPETTFTFRKFLYFRKPPEWLEQ